MLKVVIDTNVFVSILWDGECVFPTEEINICDDIEDNKLIECAIEGKVDFIITGDKKLLSLSSFRNIKIISPSNFLKNLK